MWLRPAPRYWWPGTRSSGKAAPARTQKSCSVWPRTQCPHPPKWRGRERESQSKNRNVVEVNMHRRLFIVAVVMLLAIFESSCHNNTKNPLLDVNSKQPDKVLYDRAMAALKVNKFDVARLSLQTLINTYPDSEYIARAKLAVGDSWYAEGGTASLQQAEIEYKDFITFFPNMPEAAEAQMKIANIHFQQMEK